MKSFAVIFVLFYCFIGVWSADKCALGPSYWCSDIKNAKECNAVKHCITTVWANTVVTKDSSQLCQWCTELVNKAHQMISDKATQAEIINILEQQCALIPLPELSQECKNIIDEYLPELFDMIAAQLDPQIICTALNLCNRKTSLIKVPILKDPSTYCDDCKRFLNDVIAMVSQSKDELLAVLNQICDQLPPDISGLCHQAVSQYINQIYSYIVNQIDPNEICQAIGFCSSSTNNPALKSLFERIVQTNSLDELSAMKKPKKILSNDNCDDCIKFISDVKESISNNKTADQLLALLNNLCDSLGSQLSSMCRELVKEYYLVIFDYLVNNLDPKKVCYIIQFCKSQTKVIEAPRIQQLPIERMDITLPKPLKDTGCVLCEFVIKQLDDMLKDNKTEEAIREALDQVCNLLPKTIAEQCVAFIDEYAEGILVLLAQEMQPDMVCTALGLCQSSLTNVANLPCDVCTMMIQILQNQLVDNSTEQEITYMVDKVCFLLPSQVKTQCLSIVNTYGPYLIQMLASLINPELICRELGICKTPTGHIELIGGNKCLYGPSYWCKDKVYAQACKAEEHCRRHVWKI